MEVNLFVDGDDDDDDDKWEDFHKVAAKSVSKRMVVSSLSFLALADNGSAWLLLAFVPVVFFFLLLVLGMATVQISFCCSMVLSLCVTMKKVKIENREMSERKDNAVLSRFSAIFLSVLFPIAYLHVEIADGMRTDD